MGKKRKRSRNLFLTATERISRFLNVIAGISLTLLMFLTVADVLLRAILSLGRWLIEQGMLLPLGNIIIEHVRPIVGTYELVALLGAVVIGFSVPLTSWLRGHIYVDFFIFRFSQRTINVFNCVTRSMGIFLFLMIGWNLFKYGMDLQQSGEVSLTLQIPAYPIVFGVGICCFAQCLVLIGDFVKILGGSYDE
ncbi:MAG: TRAP transporter small permease [Desulfobacterales bacterium]|nr:TRAP transporter small permease [Desulfobacterales bacterium]